MTVSPLMAKAQAGLFEEPGNSAHYLECHWPKALPLEKLKEALVEALKPIAGAYIAVGFGVDAWSRMQPEFIPEELVSFPMLKGKHGYEMASTQEDRKSTRLNSSHVRISYAVFCLKKKT